MRLSEYLRGRERDYRNKKDVHASMVEKNGIVYRVEVRFEPNCGANKFQSIVGCINNMSDGALVVTSGLDEFRQGILSIKVDYAQGDHEIIDRKTASTMQILLEHLLPNLGK